MSDTTQTFQNLAPSAGAKFRQRTLPILIFAACLAAIPMVGPSRTFYTIAHQMGINIVFALSYNMILGKGGLLSFGHAVYFGFGGYVAMHAMNWIEDGSGLWAGFPVFFLPLVGFAGGALAGAIIGWPSCRKAGTTFAMISLGVAELVFAAAFMFDSFFGGEQGISGDRMNGVELFGLSMGPKENLDPRKVGTLRERASFRRHHSSQAAFGAASQLGAATRPPFQQQSQSQPPSHTLTPPSFVLVPAPNQPAASAASSIMKRKSGRSLSGGTPSAADATSRSNSSSGTASTTKSSKSGTPLTRLQRRNSRLISVLDDCSGKANEILARVEAQWD